MHQALLPMLALLLIMAATGCEYSTEFDNPRPPATAPAEVAIPALREQNRQQVLVQLGAAADTSSGPVLWRLDAGTGNAIVLFVEGGHFVLTGACSGTATARIVLSQELGIVTGLPVQCGAPQSRWIDLVAGSAALSMESTGATTIAAMGGAELVPDQSGTASRFPLPRDAALRRWAVGILGEPGPYQRLVVGELNGPTVVPDSAADATFDVILVCQGHRSVKVTFTNQVSGAVMATDTMSCTNVRTIRTAVKNGGFLLRLEPEDGNGPGMFGYRIVPVRARI